MIKSVQLNGTKASRKWKNCFGFFNSEEQTMSNVKQVHIIFKRMSTIYPDY